MRYRQSVQAQNKTFLLGSSDSVGFKVNNYLPSDTKPVEWHSQDSKGTPILGEQELGKYEQVLLGLYDRKFPGTWKEVTGTEYVLHLSPKNVIK